MSYIYTNTGKWEDNWFLYLSNDAKILFYYISEKCNNGGFYEINKKLMLVQTNLTETRSRECLLEIKKAYTLSVDKKTLWLRNYIKYQRKLPLKDNVTTHRQIINFLKINLENPDKFPNNEEIKKLLPISEIKRKVEENVEPTKKFVKPTIEEVESYMVSKNIPNANVESSNFINFYESKGWKVGKNQMKSWKSAVDGTWARSIKDRNKDKFSVLEQGYEANKKIDWNEKINK
jgi:hypothetical protein